MGQGPRLGAGRGGAGISRSEGWPREGGVTQTGLVTLFSSLTLPPGTYYLVLGSSVSENREGGWLDAFTCDASFMCVPPTVTVGVGVSRNEDFLTGLKAAYAPASGFRQGVGIRGGDPFLDY
jgi:hypothetical protein